MIRNDVRKPGRPRRVGLAATLAVLLVTVALAGCESGTSAEPTLELRATVEGMGGWQQVHGASVASWTLGNNSFGAAIEIAGDAPGSVRPWRMHRNTCAEGGDVVGSPGSYPNMAIQLNGTGFASTVVLATLDPDASYHVTVRRSAADDGTIIACGDMDEV